MFLRAVCSKTRTLIRPPVLRTLREYNSKINAANLKIERAKNLKPKPKPDSLVFGTEFTDHMLEIDWDAKNGWSDPKIIPYGNLSISPAASTMHYGMGCFEGMKAFKDAKGDIRLFRPNMNVARLENSVARLALPSMYGGERPTFDDSFSVSKDEGFLDCLKELIKLDKDWIPSKEGYSLYIRPTAIGNSPCLGVRKSDNCKVFVILSPAGPYYASGFVPVKLYADTDNVRAWPGGVGNVKLAGNYAPTILPASQALEKHGCNSSLWLFGEEHAITEVGAMNIFFCLRNKDGSGIELVTAPLSGGDILPGVTRDSILKIARGWSAEKAGSVVASTGSAGSLEVCERYLTMAEVVQAESEGRLLESFGAGTAVSISPVRSILYQGRDIVFPTADRAGPIAQEMWDTLYGIQYGKSPSPWSVVV